jgi:hypothetical protein
MIEAVENHMPETVVIDEIGTEAEAFAARTIAERGVALIATAHGNSLENLLMNPTLSDLVGGIQAVTLSDDEAKRRGTQKTVLERKAPPTFDVVIEIMEVDKLAIHHDVSRVVDRLLRGTPPRPEIRVRNKEGEVEIVQDADVHSQPAEEIGMGAQFAPKEKALPQTARIFPYGVSRNRLERAIRELKVPAYITKDWREADIILTLKAHAKKEPTKLREATGSNTPTYIIKSNTYTQIAGVIKSIFKVSEFKDEDQALNEAEEAVERILNGEVETAELMPQNSYVRRLQHQIIAENDLVSISIGNEPYRHIQISKP